MCRLPIFCVLHRIIKSVAYRDNVVHWVEYHIINHKLVRKPTNRLLWLLNTYYHEKKEAFFCEAIERKYDEAHGYRWTLP